MKVKIGLEIHVAISNTKTKLFCSCPNKVVKEPNSICCPTCIGLPGSKPRVNREVINSAIGMASALNCRFPGEMFFSRKVYEYVDLPKGYQVTQYELPLGREGLIQIKSDGKLKKIRITRIHLEEDPGKIIHVGGDITRAKYTLVDYNRSGVPLCEIVTEPDFKSPEEVRLFLAKLSSILDYLGVYDASREGALRVDANISLEGGVRVEIKNITSFKDVETALKYEIVRQGNLVKGGKKVERETRAWNSALKVTKSLRTKEEESEYGYIYDGDLPKISLDRSKIEVIKNKMPELPDQRFRRFVRDYHLPEKVAESIVSEWDLAELFEQVAKGIDPRLAGTWISGYLKKTLNWHGLMFRESGLKPEWIVSLLKMFKAGKITDRNAEMAIRRMVEEKRKPEGIIRKHNLGKAALDLDSVVKKVLDKNKQALEDYKKGEEKALHFLVGQVMRETRGQADAGEIRKAILKLLK